MRHVTVFFHPTVDDARELSSGACGMDGVPQGLLEARFTPQLLVQRLDGLLCLLAPAGFWMKLNREETKLY